MKNFIGGNNLCGKLQCIIRIGIIKLDHKLEKFPRFYCFSFLLEKI